MISEEILNHPVAAQLNNELPGAAVDAHTALGQLTFFIDPVRIVDVCRHFKQVQKFERLSGITAVDWNPADPRFEVVYLLQSIEQNLRVRLKCRVGGADPELQTVTSVWRGADWYEREVADLFGIRFTGHPNPRRILMPDDWEGHPLRKDYAPHGQKYSYQNE